MTNLNVFSFDNNQIRFIDGKPVAKDVATVLGFKNPSDAVYRLVKPKNKGVCKIQTPGGKQLVTVLEEAGIYQLIFSSKLASAEKFQDWVFEEVLPSIRKTGKYEIITEPPKQAIQWYSKRVLEAKEKMDATLIIGLYLKNLVIFY